jgi:aminopeptidase N
MKNFSSALKIGFVLFAICFCSISIAADSNNLKELKYAPDRNVDILHIIIDVTPDFNEASVAGAATIKFAPIAKPLTDLRLSAFNLLVSSVTSDKKIAGYNVAEKEIVITFEPAIEPGSVSTVTIAYTAHPDDGLSFRTPQLGYKPQDIHLFSQGESHSAPFWYPNYDYPNEHSTSEIICHVPPDMTVLANGKLISEQVDKKTGLKTVRWFEDLPHVNYLIALVAGKFDKVESKHKNIPLAFYTTPSNISFAQTSFEDTADIMDFFEKEIGVDYPWNKYYQVTVADFGAGGMENTTLTVLNERTLFTPDFENLRSSTGLVAHEMAHQWFGDYVTCKDWGHVWLNEGFATYYEKLYDGHKNGPDKLLYSLYMSAKQILARQDEERPVVYKAYEDAEKQFNYLTYGKGGWVLHMLRCQLGEDLYRKCIKTYLEKYKFSSAVTEDLLAVIEELSGRSWDRFFDEYARLGRFPELNISYDWSQKDKLAKISIEQTQAPFNGIQLYHFPVKFRFVVDGKNIDKEVNIDSKQQDFYFPLSDKPKIVRFDPDYTVLAKVTFDLPRELLYAQVENTSDCIGRLLAIEQLQKKSDKTTIDKLKFVLNNDPFYGVRNAASSALEEIGTDESFEALADSTKQSDARVHQNVLRDIGSIYRPESQDIILKALAEEKNPDIVASCIRSLSLYHNDKSRTAITAYLDSVSFKDCLANAAIDAIRKLDEPNLAPVLKTTIEKRQGVFAPETMKNALDAIASVARDLDDKTSVREFIAAFVTCKNQKIRESAVSALGTLGDEKSQALVESLASDPPHLRIQRIANEALEKIRKGKKLVPDEVVKLRKIVDEIKDENKKIKKDIEDLNKRLTLTTQDANQPAAGAPADQNIPL